MTQTITKGLPNGQPQLNELFWDMLRRRLSQTESRTEGEHLRAF